MVFATDIPQFEEHLGMTASAEVIYLSRSVSSPNNTYTVCSYDFNSEEKDDHTIFASSSTTFIDSINKMDLIRISNIIFAGSKPLASKETEILNKALAKSISQFPTKL